MQVRISSGNKTDPSTHTHIRSLISLNDSATFKRDATINNYFFEKVQRPERQSARKEQFRILATNSLQVERETIARSPARSLGAHVFLCCNAWSSQIRLESLEAKSLRQQLLFIVAILSESSIRSGGDACLTTWPVTFEFFLFSGVERPEKRARTFFDRVKLAFSLIHIAHIICFSVKSLLLEESSTWTILKYVIGWISG